MQLPPTDELVLISGTPPLCAKKVHYFQDRRLVERVLPPPEFAALHVDAVSSGRAATDDWTLLPTPRLSQPQVERVGHSDLANSGVRREPELPEHEAIVREAPQRGGEFTALDDEPDRSALRAAALRRSLGAIARQAAMDPDDGMAL